MARRIVAHTHDNISCIERHHLLKPDCNNVCLMICHVKPRTQIQISWGPAPIHIVGAHLHVQYSYEVLFKGDNMHDYHLHVQYI